MFKPRTDTLDFCSAGSGLIKILRHRQDERDARSRALTRQKGGPELFLTKFLNSPRPLFAIRSPFRWALLPGNGAQSFKVTAGIVQGQRRRLDPGLLTPSVARGQRPDYAKVDARLARVNGVHAQGQRPDYSRSSRGDHKTRRRSDPCALLDTRIDRSRGAARRCSFSSRSTAGMSNWTTLKVDLPLREESTDGRLRKDARSRGMKH